VQLQGNIDIFLYNKKEGRKENVERSGLARLGK
jgi:hypothetical protein